jgi:leucine-rich repeat protein SHOC2
MSTVGLANCNLQSRQLLNCPAEVLLRSTVLTSLNLNRNKIVNLPRNINCLSLLVSLDLDCNELQQVPHEIGYIPLLQHLSIRNNVLISVPRSFGSLTALKSLYLSSNNIVSIPPELFVNLPRCGAQCGSHFSYSPQFCGSLELCWLGQNRIEVFSKPNPGQRYNVPRLQQLWLNMNMLREAPQEVLSSALTDLRYPKPQTHARDLVSQLRSLDHNRIRAFPDFQALGCLRNLRMQHNEVTAFLPSMTALVQLKEMDLSQASLFNCCVGRCCHV